MSREAKIGKFEGITVDRLAEDFFLQRDFPFESFTALSTADVPNQSSLKIQENLINVIAFSGLSHGSCIDSETYFHIYLIQLRKLYFNYD